jgi:tetratricopeptide (TPR) repeat protein
MEARQVSTERDRQRSILLRIYGAASVVLSAVIYESLSSVVTGGRGIVRIISIGVLVLVALAWVVTGLALTLPGWRARLPRGAATGPTELAAAAEQAEHWLVALGSDSGGMAAAEWFEREEPALRRLVAEHAADPGAADELAHICDALDAWYIRERRAGDLLDLAGWLGTLAEHARRRDLKELAAARAATAHRLAGDLDTASRELGRSADLAARGGAAPALKARRQVERALANLARADRCEPGGDLDEHLANARDRLEDAAATLPRADVAGDTAIQLDQSIVALYRQDGELARDRLSLVVAQAQAAKDVSTEAHAQELLGVAAWMLEHPHEAAARWQSAERLYADIEEREGQARCLQHLGSAAHVSAVVSRQVRRDDESDQEPALRLLERSARLRGGSHGHEVLEYYLKAADGDAAPGDGTDADVPPAAGLLRRLWRALTRRLRWRRDPTDPADGGRD